GNLDQREFAFDVRTGLGQVDDAVNGHEALELRLDLIDDLRRAFGNDRDPAYLVVFADVGHGEAVDVITARGEQPGDLGEDARLVVDGDGEHVALGVAMLDFHHTSAFASSSMVPACWSP